MNVLLSLSIQFLLMRDKMLSIDRRDIEMKSTYISTRTEHKLYFLFTSKGLTLEGFTTFLDCCLKTRASNVARNEVDYLGGID